MRLNVINRLSTLAHIIAVLLCLAAIVRLTTTSAAAQDAANNIDAALRVSLANNETVRAIIQMRLPANSAPVQQDMDGNGSSEKNGSFRARAAVLRADVQQARQNLAYNLALAGIEIDRDFAHLPFLISTLNRKQLEQISQSTGILGVYEDRAFRIEQATTREEEAAAQPSLFFSRQDVNADQAWAQGATGAGQAVVILDTGVSASHPMFSNKIIAEACFSTTFLSSHTSLCPSGGSQQIGPGTASLCPSGSLGVCSHGSHVAGIAIGNDPSDPTDGRGIAIDADLIPMQVFTRIDDEDVCTEDDGPTEQSCLVTFTSAHLAGLNHTIDLAATHDIAAVNMSFGGEPVTGTCNNTPIRSATNTLRNLGIAVVAAAGNDGEIGQMSDPACISGVVSVGAVIITAPTSFTNVSELTDIMAPGFSIKSARIGSGYQFASGTSMAAPHVAGAFAILKSAHPTATVAEMELALENGGPATNIAGASFTVPRLDVAAGLSLLDPELEDDPPPQPSPDVAATVLLNIGSSDSPGPESHIRVFNPTSASGSVSAEVRDGETGETLGTWISDLIPPEAAPQFAISHIEQNLTPQFTTHSDIPRYTLFLTSTFEGYAQHVSWDPAAGFLTNLTACNTAPTTQPLDLLNVHTSQVVNYPSSILIYNGSETSSAVQIDIHNGETGELLGNWETPDIESKASRTFAMSSIQVAAKLLPLPNDLHYTLRIDPAFDGFAQHFVDNTVAEITVNMTAACALATQ